MSGIAPLTYVWLIATPFAIAVGQVLFKMTSEKLVDSGAPFISVLINPVFLAALALYGSATLLWIHVLKTVPLAYAYSFMALTFVVVPLLAAWWLGETVGLKYALGAGLIILGLVIVQS